SFGSRAWRIPALLWSRRTPLCLVAVSEHLHDQSLRRQRGNGSGPPVDSRGPKVQNDHMPVECTETCLMTHATSSALYVSTSLANAELKFNVPTSTSTHDPAG